MPLEGANSEEKLSKNGGVPGQNQARDRPQAPFAFFFSKTKNSAQKKGPGQSRISSRPIAPVTAFRWRPRFLPWDCGTESSSSFRFRHFSSHQLFGSKECFFGEAVIERFFALIYISAPLSWKLRESLQTQGENPRNPSETALLAPRFGKLISAVVAKSPEGGKF